MSIKTSLLVLSRIAQSIFPNEHSLQHTIHFDFLLWRHTVENAFIQTIVDGHSLVMRKTSELVHFFSSNCVCGNPTIITGQDFLSKGLVYNRSIHTRYKSNKHSCRFYLLTQEVNSRVHTVFTGFYITQAFVCV